MSSYVYMYNAMFLISNLSKKKVRDYTLSATEDLAAGIEMAPKISGRKRKFSTGTYYNFFSVPFKAHLAH